MPIEVGEIGISVNVADRSGAPASGATSAEDSCERDQAAEQQREDLVDECVRRVLAVLRAQQER